MGRTSSVAARGEAAREGFVYDDRFQTDLEKRRRMEDEARCLLGVGRDASGDELKRAWRAKCLEYHPDRNPDDPDAASKLIAVNCAYRFLQDGTPCPALLEACRDRKDILADEKYNLDNPWGVFLWWKDRFF